MLSVKNNKVEKTVHAQRQNYLTISIMSSKIIHLAANSQVNQTWAKKYLKNLWNILMQEISLKTKTLMKVILKTGTCLSKYFKIKMKKHSKIMINLKTIMKIHKIRIIISVNMKPLENVIKKKQQIFRLKKRTSMIEFIIKTFWVMKKI